MVMMVIATVYTMASTEESKSTSDWQFSLAPMYLWAVSIDGEQTVNGRKVDLDVPFDEIKVDELDHLAAEQMGVQIKSKLKEIVPEYNSKA